MRKRRKEKRIFFIILAILFLIILYQRIRIDHLIKEQQPSNIETGDTDEQENTVAAEEEATVTEMADAGGNGSDVIEEEATVTEITDAGGNATAEATETAAKKTSIFDIFHTNSDEEDEFILEDDEMEQKTLMVTAKQISPSCHKEAILAQCVIARTCLYDAKENDTAEPEGMSLADMKKAWGDNFERYYQVLEECVIETRGEALTYNGTYIYAAYHAVSSGTTRNISELYESVNMPYLKAVSCPNDAVADGYLSVLYFEKNQFLEMCQQLAEETLTSMEQIQILKRDSADYVLEIQLGSETFSGEEFRTALGINSACFTITEMGENVRIVTKGIGHGFGLSQHTAEEMAESGYTYQEILETFFPDTILENKKES